MLPLVAANLGLLAVFDLARHLVLTLLLAGIGFAALPFAARRLTGRFAQGPPQAARAVLLGALLLRIPLLPLPPTLSDDVRRYLWDGRVISAGQNPYALAPEAPELQPLRDRAGGLPPHPEVPTIYPPLALAGFSIAAHLPFPTLSWKLLATTADLGACLLLLRLARRLGLPPGRVVWYAWNPLVALEVAAMGHVDVLGVAAALGAVSLLPLPGEPARRRRALAAGAWATVAALAKAGPIVAFPLWARRSGRPLAFLGAALGLVALGLGPVIVSTAGLPPGFVRYGLSWEFNGPLHEPLWRLLDAAGAAPALARGLDHLKERWQVYYAWNWIYPYLYPQLLAKLLLGLLALAAIARSLAERHPVAGTGRLFGRLLLVSATVYPWYLLWILPWAALARHRAWLALSALCLLSYLPQLGGIPLWPWIYLAIWIPFFTFLAVETRARRWSTA